MGRTLAPRTRATGRQAKPAGSKCKGKARQGKAALLHPAGRPGCRGPPAGRAGAGPEALGVAGSPPAGLSGQLITHVPGSGRAAAIGAAGEGRGGGGVGAPQAPGAPARPRAAATAPRFKLPRPLHPFKRCTSRRDGGARGTKGIRPRSTPPAGEDGSLQINAHNGGLPSFFRPSQPGKCHPSPTTDFLFFY